MSFARVRTIVIGALLSLVTSAAVVTVAAPAAQATVFCYWHLNEFYTELGDSSNCDGWDPDILVANHCGSASTSTIYSVQLRSPQDNSTIGAWAQLRYNGNCRVVWGRIVGGWGRDYSSGGGCIVYIHRNSDGEQLEYDVPPNTSGGWTDVLFDANVTSYAEAWCDTTAGQWFTARTPNW